MCFHILFVVGKVYSQNIEKPIIVFGLNGTFIIITGTKYKKVDEVGAGTDLYIDRRQWPLFFFFFNISILIVTNFNNFVQ